MKRLDAIAKILQKNRSTTPSRTNSYLEFVIKRSLGKPILKTNNLPGRLLVDRGGERESENPIYTKQGVSKGAGHSKMAVARI